MTHERDIDRILGHWLADGPTEVPDRVMDVIADRIARQPQRQAWRLDWRNPNMHTSLRAAAVLAAVVVLAVGAVYLWGPPSGSDVGGPAATPSAIPTPSPTPSPSPSSISSDTFKPTLSLVAPAGWTGSDGDRTFILEGPAAPSGARDSVGVMSGPFVSFNDRDCENRAPAGVGTTVAEVVATLAADARLVVTSPQPVTIGGRAGQMLDIQVAPDWTGTCAFSSGDPAVLVLSASDTGPAFGTGGTERVRYIFLDVEGSLVSINAGAPNGSLFEVLMAQVMPIIQSMRFTP